jgi:hypothetical protein
MPGGTASRRVSRQAFRLALAGTLAFAFAEYQGWEFSFLAPMLAVQLLGAMPSGIKLRQAMAIPILLGGASLAALAVSTFLGGNPGIMLLVIGLVVFWAFYAERRGAPAFPMSLIRIAFCIIPVVATISTSTAAQLAWFLFLAGLAAVAIVLVAHALLPTPAIEPLPQAQAAPATDAGAAGRIALSDTIVLLPLLIAFVIGGDINNIVILIITLNILREIDPSRGARLAMGFILGNLLGGAVAVFAHEFVVLADSFLFFLLAVLVPSLWFAGRVVRGGPNASIYLVGLATFILVLGLGLSPMPGASAESFAVRILKLAIGSAYTIGALSLVLGLRRSSPADIRFANDPRSPR